MKFFLNQEVYVNLKDMESKHSVPGTLPFTIFMKPDTILPVNDQGNPEEVQELCAKLKKRLFGLWQEKDCSVAWLHWEMVPHRHDSTGWVGLRIMSGPVTNALIELFGFDVKIQMTFPVLCNEKKEIHGGGKSKEMKVQSGQNYACEDKEAFKNLSSSQSLYTSVYNCYDLCEFGGQLTLTVIVDESIGPMVDDKLQVLRKMLHDELGSDLVVILENGKQVKAHKGVLLAHSDVFKAMFQSDMMEANTSTLEMPDMSEEAVRGLLAYLYCWEEEEPNAKPLVAFEMLHSGHKYNIPVLETAMEKLLLAKPTNWFDGDVALKLFLFAKKLPGGDGDHLKMKAVKVMKTHFENFKKTDAYISLFKEEPEMAMEICSHFATV